MFYTDTSKSFRGRKAAIGSPVYYKDSNGTNQLTICVGYCGDCRHKVLATFDEARLFAKKFNRSVSTPRFKLLIWVLNKLTGMQSYQNDLDERVRSGNLRIEKALTKY